MAMLAFHLVKSAYGQWLPGDERGHRSKAWDEQIGYTRPHTLVPGDPARRQMAQRQMRRQAVTFSPPMIQAIADAVSDLVRESQGGLSIAAAAIEPTHMHLLIPNTGRDIDATAKWIGDRTTKAIHRHTPHHGPVMVQRPMEDDDL